MPVRSSEGLRAPGSNIVAMEERTLQKQSEILESLEEIDVGVTDIELKEYVRGDPTESEKNATGAEIKITAYLSYDV